MNSSIASTSAPPEFAASRLLDYWEGRFAAIHALYAGANTIIAPARVSGPLTPELLEAALARMVARRPILRTQLQMRPPAHLQVQAELRPLPLRVLPTVPQRSLEALAEAEAAVPVGARDGLWRLTLAPGGAHHGLILTINHAIFDGRSIAAFFDELLEEAQGFLEDAPPRAEVPLPPRPSERLRSEAEPAAWEEAQRARDRDYAALAPWPWEAAVPARGGVHRDCHLWFEPDEVRALLAAASGAGVTLHSLLASAVVEAAAAIGRPPPFRVVTPVDLRSDCEPNVPLDRFGCFVGILGVQLAHEPDPVQRARAYHMRLRALRAKTPLLPIGGVSGAHESRPPPGHFLPEFYLTNVGVVRVAPRRGPFRLESLSFATSRRAGDSPLVVHALTLHGRLSLCTSYLSPHLSDTRAEAFCGHLRAALAAFT